MSLLGMMVCALQVSKNLTIYPLVPPEAGQGYKFELFELAEPIEMHYHKVQRQIILVAEGELKAFYGSKEPVVLKSGELIQVDPGIVHSLIPEGTVRFFSIDLPGFVFPEDVFYDMPQERPKWSPQMAKSLPTLDSKVFGSKIDAGNYSVYELISGSVTEEKWSVALLEIQDSPRHFHRIEKEIFVVVNGALHIEIDGTHHILEVGESVTLFPEQKHQLKSANNEPVRVLCFSFPAFHPSDMYVVKECDGATKAP